MAKFASGTDVPIEKSRAEVERILRRYGATACASASDATHHMISFEMLDRRVMFMIHTPRLEEFTTFESGKTRPKSQVSGARDQEERRRWRVLVICLKAKFELVETGMVEFEEEFLAHIVLPNAQLVSDFMRPQIAIAYESGKMPALLPEF